MMKDDAPRQSDHGRGDTHSRVLDCAVRILTRRDHTCLELAVKLRRKGFDPAAIDHALVRCGELGYLDDGKTALTLARHLVDRGYGPLRIQYSLAQKGLSEALIEQALACCGGADIQVRSARAALGKKRSRLNREVDPWKRRQMAYRFLSGRGFPAAVIHRAIADL